MILYKCILLMYVLVLCYYVAKSSVITPAAVDHVIALFKYVTHFYLWFQQAQYVLFSQHINVHIMLSPTSMLAILAIVLSSYKAK